MTDFRYFIAIIPPDPIYSEAQLLKEQMRDRYNTQGALRSPPHITLHMPFLWRENKTDLLVESLERLSGHLTPTEIILRGFGCFPPRVIFLHVERTPELTALQRSVREYVRINLNILNDTYKDQPFHPHLTIAFRDLKKDAFRTAWDEFRSVTFNHKFTADELVLLKYDGHHRSRADSNAWNIFRRFSFQKNPIS